MQSDLTVAYVSNGSGEKPPDSDPAPVELGSFFFSHYVKKRRVLAPSKRWKSLAGFLVAINSMTPPLGEYFSNNDKAWTLRKHLCCTLI